MVLHDETRLVQGIPAHVVRGGTGPPLLVLHGWGSRADRYRETFTLLPDDAASVAIPDLPGFGETVLPSSGWGIHEYAIWARDLIAALGWKKCVLLGHSFGGRMSIVLAATSPELVNALILYASAGVTPRSPARMSFFRALAKAGAALFSLPAVNVAAPVARRVLYRLAGSRDYPNAGNLEEVFVRVIAQDCTEYLPRITVPTSILWGRDDHKTPLSDAEKIHRLVPNSMLRVLDGEAHAIHLKNPKRFAEELARMLRRFSA